MTLDNKLHRLLAGDLPLMSRPWQALGAEVNLSEDEVLNEIKELIAAGKIRRVGAVLKHRQAGITANCLTVWRVPPERIKEVGKMAAEYPEISHCYARKTLPAWPYNLYTMIHGRSEDECRDTAARLAKEAGLTEYRLLFSRRELKKTSFQP